MTLDPIAQKAFYKFVADRRWSGEEVSALEEYVRAAGKTFKSEEHARESLAGHLRSRHFPAIEVEAFTDFAQSMAEHGVYDDGSLAPPEQPGQAARSAPVATPELHFRHTQILHTMRTDPQRYWRDPALQSELLAIHQELSGETHADREAWMAENNISEMVEARAATPAEQVTAQAMQVLRTNPQEYYAAVKDPGYDAALRQQFGATPEASAVAEQSGAAPAATGGDSE